jgi:hypothetical protein
MALPSFLCPHAILSLNDQMTHGPPNQRTRSISPFRLQEFRFSNSSCSQSISPRVHDPMTRVPLRSMVEISLGLWTSKISILNLRLLRILLKSTDSCHVSSLNQRSSFTSGFQHFYNLKSFLLCIFPGEVLPIVHDPLTRILATQSKIENTPKVIFRSDDSYPLKGLHHSGLRVFGRVLVVKLPKQKSRSDVTLASLDDVS